LYLKKKQKKYISWTTSISTVAIHMLEEPWNGSRRKSQKSRLPDRLYSSILFLYFSILWRY